MAQRDEKNLRPADEEDFSDITEFRPEREAFLGESGPVPMKEERTIHALQRPWVILLMLGSALILAGIGVFFYSSVTTNRRARGAEPTSMIPQSRIESSSLTTESETEITSVEISEKTKAAERSEAEPSGEPETEASGDTAENGTDTAARDENEEDVTAGGEEYEETEAGSIERTEITLGDALFRIDNGGLTLMSYTGSDEVVSFPESIEGYPFEGVNDEAFAGSSGVRAVILPDSVCWIGARVFTGCDSLTEVSMGSGVKDFSEEAFEGAPADLTVVAPAGSEAGIYAVYHGLNFSPRE